MPGTRREAADAAFPTEPPIDCVQTIIEVGEVGEKETSRIIPILSELVDKLVNVNKFD